MENMFIILEIFRTRLVKEAIEVSGNSKKGATYLALLDHSLRFVPR